MTTNNQFRRATDAGLQLSRMLIEVYILVVTCMEGRASGAKLYPNNQIV